MINFSYSERCRHTLRGHADSVNSIVFLPYSNTLLTCSADKTLSLWDARTVSKLFLHTYIYVIPAVYSGKCERRNSSSAVFTLQPLRDKRYNDYEGDQEIEIYFFIFFFSFIPIFFALFQKCSFTLTFGRSFFFMRLQNFKIARIRLSYINYNVFDYPSENTKSDQHSVSFLLTISMYYF